MLCLALPLRYGRAKGIECGLDGFEVNFATYRRKLTLVADIIPWLAIVRVAAVPVGSGLG
jgi:hypothetical protein